MSHKAHPTLGEIEKRCRAAARGLEGLTLRELKSCAATVDVETQRGSVDTRQIGSVQALIHESAHLAFKDELAAWGTLEEDMLETAEKQLWERIRWKPRLWLIWCRLAERKVGAA